MTPDVLPYAAREFAAELECADGTPQLEYEVRYPRDPASGVFALDVVLLDREVRRAAREVRDGAPPAPLGERRRRRPLPVLSGLVVRDAHHSAFSFLLDVPPELSTLILSEPFNFFFRVLELRLAYGWVRTIFIKRQCGGLADSREVMLSIELGSEPGPEEGLDDLPVPPMPVLPSDVGELAGVYEVVQRLTLASGTSYEVIERVTR